MDVSFATEPARRDHPNEDFVAALPNAVVLLDGAGSAGADSGCVHGVAWYARQLGAALAADLITPAELPLPEILRRALEHTAARHNGQCDLTHPGTPSATVILVRQRDAELDYLVLADSVLLVQ